MRSTPEMQESGLTPFLREFTALMERGLEPEGPPSPSRGESIAPQLIARQQTNSQGAAISRDLLARIGVRSWRWWRALQPVDRFPQDAVQHHLWDRVHLPE